MRPSQMWGELTKLFGALSHVHTILSFLPVLKGEEPPEDAPPALKGLMGILGWRDERVFLNLLERLEKKHPGSRAILAGFFQWLAIPGETWEVRLANWFYFNRLRTLIIGMDAERQKAGDTTVEVTTRGADKRSSTKTTKTTHRWSKTTHNAYGFLKMIVQTIESERKPGIGYRTVLHLFRNFGIPLPPKNVTEVRQWVEEHFKNVPASTRDRFIAELDKASEALEARDQRRKSERLGWLYRSFEAIFG